MIPLLQNQNESPTRSIHLHKLSVQDYMAPYHIHPEYELTLVYGKGKRIIGNRIETISGIDLVLIAPYLPHCWFNYKSIQALTVHFSTTSINHANCSLPELNLVSSLLQQTCRGLHFKGLRSSPSSIGLKVYAREIEHMTGQDDFERLISLMRILRMMSNDPGKTEVSGVALNLMSYGHSQRIRQVFDYIYENFTIDLSIQKVADQAGLSVSAFCHFFKKHTQKRFSDYVNEIRVGYASKLLYETQRNISEIAYQSGYNSLSNFNKRFREINGVSPSAYRKQ